MAADDTETTEIAVGGGNGAVAPVAPTVGAKPTKQAKRAASRRPRSARKAIAKGAARQRRGSTKGTEVPWHCLAALRMAASSEPAPKTLPSSLRLLITRAQRIARRAVRDTIAQAMRRAGTIAGAAEMLGMADRTLTRWLGEDELLRPIDAARPLGRRHRKSPRAKRGAVA